MWGSCQSLFKITKLSLKLRNLKHSLLSSNIANVDTPGYRRKDLPFEKVIQTYLSGEKVLKTTHPQHKAYRDSNLKHLLSSFEPQDLGTPNNVSLEEEMTAMVENQLLYETTLQALAKEIDRLKELITEGGR